MLKSRLVSAYVMACRFGWFFLVYAFRVAYLLKVRKIRAKVRRGEKIEVLFLVSVTSKWKCQSLFEAMKRSGCFRPRIAVSLQRRELEEMKPVGDFKAIRTRVERDVRFYENLGDETVLACDLEKMELVSLRNFNPDIVFYQEPGGPLGMHRVTHEGWHSLCCYVPYGIEAGDDVHDKGWKSLHWRPDFHKLMHLTVQWNLIKTVISRKACPAWLRAGRIESLGHPMLDVLQLHDGETNEGYVIYAPHFSFRIPGIRRALTIGTMLENGRTILSYAQRHPEMRWVFKPHPLTLWTLQHQAGWSKQEVDEYCKAWEAIGIGCYDGSYPEIFRKSKAMITDSESFLYEYPATGRSLIHLVFKDDDLSGNLPGLRPLLKSYYRVDNEADMLDTFKMVLEDGKDPKRDERLALLKEAGIVGVNAANNILECLKRELAVE